MLSRASVDRDWWLVWLKWARPAGELRRTAEIALFGVGFLLSLIVLAFSVHRLMTRIDVVVESALLHELLETGRLVLASAAIFSGSRWTVFFSLSFLAYVRGRSRRIEPAACPFVSIFVPCFNEGKTIEPALEALLELDYPTYEVLVVNDGSTDETLGRARQYEGTYGGCTVRVFDKPNGGKWSAHNDAFHRSRGELILCVDADSRLEPSSLKHLVGRMADPGIAGIAGQMRVRNRDSLLTRLQGLE